MSKYTIALYGYEDPKIQNELDFTRYKLMYNIDLEYISENKYSMVAISKNNDMLIIVNYGQTIILSKLKKHYDQIILNSLPYVQKSDKSIYYNIFFPLYDIISNQELLAYYKCLNITTYNEFTEQELYSSHIIKKIFLDLFFEKISYKEFNNEKTKYI